MKINYLELKKYKRLMLKNINYIKYSPATRAQAILGTNGSGKSSLVNELTPLPALPANFGPDGYKIISITDRGNDFLLTSDFSKSPPHSFIKNDEELNKGGTITVQKALVLKEFNLDSDIHELLTGEERFSSMSPSRRREWYTRLCETNFDYALSVFSKFRERSRDTSGALKLAKKRLVAEAAKVPTTEDMDLLQGQINDVVTEITALYENRVDETRRSHDIQTEQDSLLQELQGVSERLFLTKGHFSDRQIFTADELRVDIDIRRHEITETMTKIDLLSKEHGKLKTALDEYAKTGQEGVAGLRSKRDGFIKQREELWGRRRLQLEPTDCSSALGALESIHELLVGVLTDLPENVDRRYSSAKLLALQEKALEVKDKLKDADQRLEKLRHQREHLEQLKEGGPVECPKCTHRWVIGYTQASYDKIIEVIDKGVKFIEEQRATLNALEAEIQANVEYGAKYKEFARCVNGMPVLKPFWDHLLEGEHVFKSPTNVLRLLELFKVDLGYEIQMKALDEEVVKVDYLIEIALKASNVDMDNVKTRIDHIETELGVQNGGLHLLRTRLNSATSDCQRVMEIEKLSDEIRQYQNKLQKGFNDTIRAIRNEVINECLRQLQIDLAQKQNRLNDIKMQKGIVEDIEKNIATLTQEDAAMKAVLDALSPTDGLIAEGLLGFIRSFLRKVNRLIAKTWTYRMEVKDCSVSTDAGAELDYRFPVMIVEPNNVVPDVGKCSAGQKEIIDLAFKITAMMCSGLSDYPLILDEPTSNMDAQHTQAFGSLLKYLLEQSFSQIYLISHNYAQYGSFVNMQVCVLCPDNIVVPSRYNEHVEMH